MLQTKLRQTWYTGFDCRQRSDRIPVSRTGLKRFDARHPASLIVMCPGCGFSSRYQEQEAYRFACEPAHIGLPGIGAAGDYF
jgi:hypothetical protein